ncbi:MAG: hypothetical protein JXQ83_14770 [Candidatus Glassbacteria bacterium]|nr:hypothetical protein [Candidatus Glassbacteria bacterium]
MRGLSRVTARRALAISLLWMAVCFSYVYCQQQERTDISPERLVYPETSLCLLDPCCGHALYDPFDIRFFYNDLVSLLRSADYLTVKTQSDVDNVLARNRSAVPEFYDPKVLARICELTGCDYTAFQRLISCEIDREDGFTVPVFFHRNKVTFRVELDIAVVEGKTGSLQYSQRVKGNSSLGRGVQIFPVTVDDPSLYLGYSDREKLARLVMQDLAGKTFEALVKGINKPLSTKYVCYWQDEVHIISDKPGLCPICGSRLVKLFR